MEHLRTACLAVAALGAVTAAAQAAPIDNIVPVHGAFVDGSGWRPVYDILSRASSRSR